MVGHWQKPKDTGSNPVVIEKYAFLQKNFRKKNEKSEFKFLCSFGDFMFCFLRTKLSHVDPKSRSKNNLNTK